MIYLTAAVIFVPLAKRFGLGSVLGYLMAGIAIGPYVMGFIGEEGKDLSSSVCTFDFSRSGWANKMRMLAIRRM